MIGSCGVDMIYARTRADAKAGGSLHQASRATLLPITCFSVSGVSLRLGLIRSHDSHTLGLRLVSEFASLFEQAERVVSSSSATGRLSFRILFLGL